MEGRLTLVSLMDNSWVKVKVGRVVFRWSRGKIGMSCRLLEKRI